MGSWWRATHANYSFPISIQNYLDNTFATIYPYYSLIPIHEFINCENKMDFTAQSKLDYMVYSIVHVNMQEACNET